MSKHQRLGCEVENICESEEDSTAAPESDLSRKESTCDEYEDSLSFAKRRRVESSSNCRFANHGKKVLKVGSRKSALALWQTEHVIKLLEDKFGDKYDFKICCEKAYGDRVLDQSLVELGKNNPGLFTKELEIGLLTKTSHFAVHSLKDMPTILPSNLSLASILERDVTNDCVVLHPKHKSTVKSLVDLSQGSVIGTSSLRREALVKSLYPDLVVRVIRGNVQTRLQKLEHGDKGVFYDAIILAETGLRRVNLGSKIDFVLDSDFFPYCISQGSLGVECRADNIEVINLLKQIQHKSSAIRCTAERSLLRTLEGGCQIAMGVNSSYDEDKKELFLQVILLSRDGKEKVVSKLEKQVDDLDEAEDFGRELADIVRSNGGEKIVGRPGQAKRDITYGSAE